MPKFGTRLLSYDGVTHFHNSRTLAEVPIAECQLINYVQ